MSDLANQPQQQPLENAVEIIEKFGGIRPMASKVNIAVTTIQGWKKRGVIPANRIDTVLHAAKSQGIDLSGLVADEILNLISPPANDSSEIAEKQLLAPQNEAAFAPQVRTDIPGPIVPKQQTHIYSSPVNTPPPSFVQPQAQNQEDVLKPTGEQDNYTQLVMGKGKGVPKGVYVSLALCALLVAALVGFIMPKNFKHVEGEQVNLAEIEETPSDSDDSMFKGVVPDEVAETISTATNAIVEEGAVVAGHGIAQLEEYVTDTTGINVIGSLSDRINGMRSTALGQDSLEESMGALHGMVLQSGDKSSDAALIANLDKARAANPALNEVLAGVPRQDLKAAAMLLAMGQLRESLNRTGVPFDKDLQTLRNLVGRDDAALVASLDRLAPVAERGVLTPKGVSGEFRGLAGDLLSASLNGEDLDLVERARGRMNDVLQVEKDGKILTGSRQIEIMDETQSLINQGKFDAALEHIRKMLRSPELSEYRPWLKKVEQAMDKSLQIIKSAQGDIDKGNLRGALNTLYKGLEGKEMRVVRSWVEALEKRLDGSGTPLEVIWDRVDINSILSQLEKSMKAIQTPQAQEKRRKDYLLDGIE